MFSFLSSLICLMIAAVFSLLFFIIFLALIVSVTSYNSKLWPEAKLRHMLVWPLVGCCKTFQEEKFHYTKQQQFFMLIPLCC
jgi:hypothetical protein